MTQRHIKKYLFMSVALNVTAFGYIAASRLMPANPPTMVETKTILSSQNNGQDVSTNDLIQTQHKRAINSVVPSTNNPSKPLMETVKSSVDDTEIASSSNKNNAMTKKLDLAIEILGENYRGQLTESNLSTVAVPLLTEIATNPSYSDEEQLNALHGLEKITDKKSYEKTSLTLLNNAYTKNDKEHSAELLYELNDVDTHELADSVASFLANPDREVRVAALSALGRDKNNTYAQSLLQKHASVNPQDMLDYLKEIQPAQN